MFKVQIKIDKETFKSKVENLGLAIDSSTRASIESTPFKQRIAKCFKDFPRKGWKDLSVRYSKWKDIASGKTKPKKRRKKEKEKYLHHGRPVVHPSGRKHIGKLTDLLYNALTMLKHPAGIRKPEKRGDSYVYIWGVKKTKVPYALKFHESRRLFFISKKKRNQIARTFSKLFRHFMKMKVKRDGAR